MIFNKLFIFFFCIYNVKSQLTTTAPTVTVCQINNVCKNNGTCLVINNQDIICTCQPGFTGRLIQIF